jgi:hypothetical protein
LALRAVPAAALPVAGALDPLEGMTVDMVTVVCCVVEGQRVGTGNQSTVVVIKRQLPVTVTGFSHMVC